MANFNIGQQNAASIQNIGGDAVIEGGVHAYATWEVVELRRVIARTQEGAAALEPVDREAREARRLRPAGQAVGVLHGLRLRRPADAGTAFLHADWRRLLEYV